ncbi:conserved oligomeric Golgi complex subunit 4 isoform X3 [Adelges cooleyi]|uniref:conserved oligomeric Golgi complex subunit 4 isoform X2 n=1 Tax=Adelges cooleyi TaxID=133065 RepID=UPI00218043E1|nr:conserved oligomeric Golgi complex subunit 4 isoform X2 [Adelges cooleyi]XP_050432931.1 conserved oligomeric Golgi complex subunit 4 isoform X3 [Adelges cooleyi]
MLSMSSNEEYIAPDEVKNALALLDKEEVSSKKRLLTFSNQWHSVIKEIDSVNQQFSSLDSIKSNLCQIETRIQDSSKLAEDISSKVRQLDKIRGRVSECQKRVQDLLDLQLCSEGVQIAMKNDELEKAAAHVHRYLSIDQTKLQRTADDMAQDCSMITSSLKHLQNATDHLQNTVSKRFDQASLIQDQKSIERYFKIFPLLGMHDVGLSKFVAYLGRILKNTADKSLKNVIDTSISSNRASIVFADGLTFLFEEVAKTIEVQQPLIETHYGPDYIVQFMSQLQVHCDTFSNDILTAFLKTRKVKELLKTMWDESDPNIEKPDSKDIDLLIEEIVLILARYDLYAKFVNKHINVELESKSSTAKSFLINSKLCCSIQELMGRYLEFERYYMEESIKKAILMDTLEGDEALTSSMVDDVFFIIRKCVMRSLRSGSLDLLCAVINNAINALETDLCTFFSQVLNSGYPGSGYFNRFTPDLEKIRQTFLASLNNTEVAIEYSRSLAQTFKEEIPLKLKDCNMEKLDSCLSDFSRVNTLLVTANKNGFKQLQNSLIEPKIQAWVEQFYEYSYKMSESEFSQMEADNPFVQNIILQVDNIFKEFKNKLTSNNYDVFVVAIAIETSVQLEKVIMKTEFNRLGGMSLDKVVRTLINYFSGASAWPVREKFSRLVQVTTVLNLEQVSDLNEFLSPDSGMCFAWKLTPDNIRQILKLRFDFREEDIRKIKL